jgi:hypothetical protein
MIGRNFAMASDGLMAPQPLEGYLYAEIRGYASRRFDYTKEFGLCAYPADYPASGRLTLIIDHRGIVFLKDTAGCAVTVWPDTDAEGWETSR